MIYSKSALRYDINSLLILIKMAKYGYIQDDAKFLQKVIGDINKLSFEGNINAKEFLNIVFGEPISNIFDSSRYRFFLNLSYTYESIPKGLFSSFYNLQRVNIPNSVTKIECEAFSDCPNLSFVNIPESIEGESIGKRAFKNCPKLKCIKMPYKLTKIEDETFKGDEELSNVEMNNKLRIIGKEAFANCKSIQYLKIPGSVEMICDKAFNGCQNLKVIIFESSETKLGNDVMSPDVTIIYED